MPVKLGLSEEQLKDDWKQERCGLYVVQLVYCVGQGKGR
jgi:hypothetical protein